MNENEIFWAVDAWEKEYNRKKQPMYYLCFPGMTSDGVEIERRMGPYHKDLAFHLLGKLQAEGVKCHLKDSAYDSERKRQKERLEMAELIRKKRG